MVIILIHDDFLGMMLSDAGIYVDGCSLFQHRGVYTILNRANNVFRCRGVGLDCHQAELYRSSRVKSGGDPTVIQPCHGTEDVSTPARVSRVSGNTLF